MKIILFLILSAITLAQTIDTTVTVDWINISGQDIEVTDIETTGDVSVIFLPDTLTYPFTIANNDTLVMPYGIDRTQVAGTYELVCQPVTSYASQLPVTVRVTIETPPLPPSGGDWTYNSDTSSTGSEWTTLSSTLSIVDGISDGTTTKNNVFKIEPAATSGAHSIDANFIGHNEGDTLQYEIDYYMPTAGMPTLQFYNFATGTQVSGTRTGSTTGSWQTISGVWVFGAGDNYSKRIGSVYDATGSPGNTYVVYCKVRWKLGNYTAGVTDTTAPNGVTSLVATGYNEAAIPKTFVNLNWMNNHSSDAANILVYGSTINTLTPISTLLATLATTAVSYQDTIPESNQYRNYTVKVIDDSGNVSWSNPTDSALVPTESVTPPPNAPTNLNGTALAYNGTWRVRLTWTDNSTNEDSFRVYRNGNWIKSIATNSTIDTVTGLANNTTYSFNVSAYSITLGESALSNTKNVTTDDTTSEPPVDYNIWYVGTTSTGTGDGTSRANQVNWYTFNQNLIQPGDYVYFEQGTYSSQIRPTKSGTSTALITYMADPSNTQAVEIKNSGISGVGLWITGVSYIKVKGFYINTWGTAVQVGTGVNVIYCDSLITRNTEGAFWIRGAYDVASPSVSGTDSVWVRWCDLKTDYLTTGQTDVIAMAWVNNIFIIGNRIWQANNAGTSHNDCIQTLPGMGNITVANNLLIEQQEESSMIGMINQEWAGYRWIYYNNVSITFASSPGWAHWSATGAGVVVVPEGQTFVFHNTMINDASPNNFGKSDTLTSRNNLGYVRGGIWAAYSFGNTPVPATYTSNYNIYYNPATTAFANLNESAPRDLSFWQALGKDLNSQRANPLFVSVSGSDPLTFNLSLQAGSPALNAGTNLQSIVEGWGIEGVLWETFNNPYVNWSNPQPRDATPNIGAW